MRKKTIQVKGLRDEFVMHADVERPLSGDFHFLCDVVAASRKKTARTLAVVYIVHATCKPL